MLCPKCGHARLAGAPNPEWQCPACGIAYHKYQAHLARAKAAVQPLAADAAVPAPPADTSVWILVGANVATLVIALVQGWSLSELMLIYWAQSIIIGASYVARIWSLEKFSTKNFRMNDRPVEPTVETKRQVAFFFIVHFGIFHVAYLAFIFENAPLGLLLDPGFLMCTVGFAVNHWFSYRYHKHVDRQGTPNIGTLMFTPYLRIVPMHLTIVFGASVMGGAGLLMFGALKTLADTVMHVIEHRRLGHKAKTTTQKN